MSDVAKTDEQWREELTPEQYAVLRQKGTEAPGTGALLHNVQSGTYTCAACEAELFDSTTKFDSGSGWPSFYDAKPEAVIFTRDDSLGVAREEITCASCGGHLGHIFPDAPQTPTGQRYCVNSLSLDFVPKK